MVEFSVQEVRAVPCDPIQPGVFGGPRGYGADGLAGGSPAGFPVHLVGLAAGAPSGSLDQVTLQ